MLCTVNNAAIVTAEKLPTFILYETLEKDILRVTVSVTPDSSSAGTIKMDYNKEHLIFKNIVADSENASSVLVNPDSKGLIALNFMNINGDLSGNTNLAVIEFILKSNEFSAEDIFSNSFRLYDIDGNTLSDNTTAKLSYIIDKKSLSENNISVIKQEIQNDVDDIEKQKTKSNDNKNFSATDTKSSTSFVQDSENETGISSTESISQDNQNTISYIENNDENSERKNSFTVDNEQTTTTDTQILFAGTEKSEETLSNDTSDKKSEYVWGFGMILLIAIIIIILRMIRKRVMKNHIKPL